MPKIGGAVGQIQHQIETLSQKDVFSTKAQMEDALNSGASPQKAQALSELYEAQNTLLQTKKSGNREAINAAEHAVMKAQVKYNSILNGGQISQPTVQEKEQAQAVAESRKMESGIEKSAKQADLKTRLQETGSSSDASPLSKPGLDLQPLGSKTWTKNEMMQMVGREDLTQLSPRQLLVRQQELKMIVDQAATDGAASSRKISDLAQNKMMEIQLELQRR